MRGRNRSSSGHGDERLENVALYHFVWDVPDLGYSWREDLAACPGIYDEGEPPFLVVNAGTGWRHRPMEEWPLLYTAFAALDGLPESILAFASKYGWLGVGVDIAPPAGGQLDLGEPLARWDTEIGKLRTAARVWDWLQAGDAGKLGQHIVWPNADQVRLIHGFIGDRRIRAGDVKTYDRHRSQVLTMAEAAKATPGKMGRLDYERIAGRGMNSHEEEFRKWHLGEVVRPAQLWLVQTVNKVLAEHVSPAILLSRDSGKEYEVRPFVRPHNLLGAMWLQLSQDVSGRRRLRRCEECGGWMDVTECRKSKRMHDSCSARLRKQRYRARKRQEGDGQASPP